MLNRVGVVALTRDPTRQVGSNVLTRLLSMKVWESTVDVAREDFEFTATIRSSFKSWRYAIIELLRAESKKVSTNLINNAYANAG